MVVVVVVVVVVVIVSFWLTACMMDDGTEYNSVEINTRVIFPHFVFVIQESCPTSLEVTEFHVDIRLSATASICAKLYDCVERELTIRG